MAANTEPRRPGLLTALIVGVLVALPVVVAFFAFNALFRLPPLPINIMDWLPNNLPSALLNAGKDAMVSVLLAVSPGDVDGAAKTAEAIIGTATLFGIIVVASALVFLIARGQKAANAGVITGLIAGLVLGIVFTLMYASLPVVQFERSSYVILDAAFILAVFLLAGYAIGRIYDRLTTLPAAETISTAQAETGEPSAQPLNRRQFLVRVGGATATLTAVGAVVSLLSSREEIIEVVDTGDTGDTAASPTPSGPVETVGMDSDFVPASGTRDEYTPLEEHYRIDIVNRPPEIDGSTWTLPIAGLVNTPQSFTLEELRAMPSQSQIVTLSCISNPVGGDLISTTKWTGVPMHHILDLVQPTQEAQYIRITCADGFDEYVNIGMIRNDERIMLAYAWDDRPLLQKHGFPLRIYIPNLYGMKQPKWITNMEFVAEWEEGYWVRRGWSADATVQHTSVIDTVAESFEQDGVTYVPLGGIAYAGARGISKVEVSVDDGEWVEASLKEPLSELTWLLWRYDWPFEAGAHTFSVRCVDGMGAAQRENNTPVAPNGATGLHRTNRTL